MINAKSFFYIFDIVHIFKALRNNLINYNLKFENEDSEFYTARWKYIINTFEIDKRGPISMLPRIKCKHIYPSAFDEDEN